MLLSFCEMSLGKKKKLHLCKKDKIKHTKILIFILKIIPFIDIDIKHNFLKKLMIFILL